MIRAARLAGFLTAALGGVVHAAMPDATRFVADVVAQRTDPAEFDFAVAGFWELDQEQRTQWQWELVRNLSNPGGPADPSLPSPPMLDPTGSCDPAAQRRYAAMAWATAAMKSQDAAEWRGVRTELLQGRARFDARLDATADTVEASSAPPRVADLLRRAARDGLVHEALDDRAWSAGMSRPAEFAWYLVIRTRMLAIVCDNTEWLKSEVAGSGWFDARRFGATADLAAWQLLRRAERDAEFQSSTLAALRALPADATSQRSLAHLDDELAFHEQRLQRFGTRRLCRHDGSSTMWPDLDDPARVNERRARMGLEPIDPGPRDQDPACRTPAN